MEKKRGDGLAGVRKWFRKTETREPKTKTKIFQTKKVKIPSDLQISVRFQPKTFRIVRAIVRYNFLFPINTLI